MRFSHRILFPRRSVLHQRHDKKLPLLYLTLLSFCGTVLAATFDDVDKRPRAALVSLAHETDLADVLLSIHQLEDKFNGRYQYDWIFFSPVPLSDQFRQQTSNATSATCLYETIASDNWNIRREKHVHDVPTSPFTKPRTPDSTNVVVDKPGQPLSLVQQTYRWKTGPFARESRMKHYDWFWRIEPGATFPHQVQFDVFRFMRDRGIACGFNKAGQLNPPLRELSSQIHLFVQKHPQLLREDADLSWLEELVEDDLMTPFEKHTTQLAHDVDASQPVLIKTVHGGSRKRPATILADWQQRLNYFDFGDNEDDDERSVLADTLATWLGSIYDTALSPNSIMGSLSYFRSPEHQALLDHFDTAADIYYEPRHSVPVVSLSASMFLPKQSVWSMSEVEAEVIGRQPMIPGPTGDPEQQLEDGNSPNKHEATFHATTGRALQQLHGQRPLLAEVFALWNDCARDFERQNSIPGLRSGNTVIDERNFSLMR